MRGLGLLVLAACAHTPNLELRPETPAPAGQEVGTFEAKDGTKLWRRKWVPTAPQKGVLIIQHGLRDHSDNYDHFARRAAAAGFAVWAPDLRGHARSAGPRVAPKPWKVYIDDFDRFIGIVREAEPNQPIFLFGHSMGGAIAALTVVDRQPQNVKGLILSAAVLNLGVAPFALAAVRLLGVVGPNLGLLKLDPSAFSTNPAIGAALVKDPLVEQGAGPASTASGLAAGAAEIWTGIDKLTLPILALHGTVDKLTAPSGSRALIAHAPSTDKTLRIYEGFSHDLVHEPKGVQVEDDVLAWLAAHTGGPAVTPPPLYTGKLHGDPAGRMVAVQIGGGATRGFDTTSREVLGLFEFTLHVAKRRTIGWGGTLNLRAGAGGFFGTLAPAGLALKLGRGGTVGLASGATLLDGELAIPVRLWLEQSLGPVHLTLRGQVDYQVSGTGASGGIVGEDLLDVGATLRVPGDRDYWPGSRAGVGLYLQAGVLRAGRDESFIASLGLALFGAD